MGKSYAFWRDETGRPYRGHDGKHAPTDLFGMYVGTFDTTQPGRVRNSPFANFDLFLKSAFAVLDHDDVELNPWDTAQIFDKAITALVNTNQTKRNCIDFTREANAAAGAFFRMPEKHYVLITSLSTGTFPAKRITIRGHVITPLRDRKRYPLPDRLKREPKLNYKWIRIEAKGRTHHQAVSNAMDALNLLRAMWTFISTYGVQSLSIGSLTYRPLGIIFVGPFTTIHNQDRTLATDLTYAKVNFQSRDIFVPTSGWEGIEKQRKWMERRLRSLRYGRDLENLFLRFISATDSAEPHTAFLQLWGILEAITQTVGAKYDDTIKRAAWMYDHPKVMENILSTLRILRNQHVHAGRGVFGAETLTQKLKLVVETHLKKLLHNQFACTTIEGYADALKLPNGLEQLTKKRAAIDRVIKAMKN